MKCCGSVAGHARDSALIGDAVCLHLPVTGGVPWTRLQDVDEKDHCLLACLEDANQAGMIRITDIDLVPSITQLFLSHSCTFTFRTGNSGYEMSRGEVLSSRSLCG